MKNLKKYCEKSLKNLKYSKAKDNYLKKVILGFLTKYTPASDENKNFSREISVQPETAMPFGQMLLEMHHPDVTEENYQQYPFDTQEHFIQYYGADCYDWKKTECSVPDSFTRSKPTMFHALKFLFSSCLKADSDESFRQFSEECLLFLTEVFCTGRQSYRKSADVWNLIQNLNAINAGVYGNGISLWTFMKSFHFHFKEKMQEYSVDSNYQGYVTSMLVSYLNGEYLSKSSVKSAESDLF